MVKWLAADVLLTRSNSIPESHISRVVPSIKIWRWLGYPRLCGDLTALEENKIIGCIGDYKDSRSFQTLSSINLTDSRGETKCCTGGNPKVIHLSNEGDATLDTSVGVNCNEWRTESTVFVSSDLHHSCVSDLVVRQCAISPLGDALFSVGDCICIWKQDNSNALSVA